MNAFCRTISRYFVKRRIIDEKYIDVYTYGLELIVSFVITSSIILIIGAFSHNIPQTLLFEITFITLRRFTGGFHAKTFFQCQLFTIASYLFVLLYSKYFCVSTYTEIIFYLLESIAIVLVAPIENKNKPLTARQRKRLKITSSILHMIVCGSAIIIKSYSVQLSNTIFYTNVVIMILLTIPLVERRVQND